MTSDDTKVDTSGFREGSGSNEIYTPADKRALPREMARVRELLPIYDSIPTGIFAATMMRQDLDAAAKAMAEGDVVEMIRRLESLKGYSS